MVAEVASDERLHRHIEWMRAGTRVLADQVGTLAGTDPGAPCGLSGWTRGHLLAHLSLNASALINLLTWARTGVVTPMYPSREARSADIEARSTLAISALLEGIETTAYQLDEAVAALPVDAWKAQIRTATGREAPASIVPWMRDREVWVHSVDLDTGFTFAAIPADVLSALLADMAQMMTPRLESESFSVLPNGAPAATPFGTAEPAREISGDLADLVSWLSGRQVPASLGPVDDLPKLPAWL